MYSGDGVGSGLPACCCMSRHSTAVQGCLHLRGAMDLNQQRFVLLLCVCVGGAGGTAKLVAAVSLVTAVEQRRFKVMGR
jgi:hypothetical protein